MRKFCGVKTTVHCGLLAVAFLAGMTIRQAEARPWYPAWWVEAYPEVAKKQEVAAKVKCNVCHYGSSKKNRNAYGKALQKAFDDKAVPRKTGKKDFLAGLKKVEEEKSAVEGKTFGDLLKAGDLPAKAK